MPDSRLFQYNQSPSQNKGSRYTEISTAFYAFFCRFYIVVRIAVSLIKKISGVSLNEEKNIVLGKHSNY